MLLIDSLSICVQKATGFFDKKLVTALGHYYRYYVTKEQASLAWFTPQQMKT